MTAMTRWTGDLLLILWAISPFPSLAFQKYTIPWWHPEIQYAAEELIAGPWYHPLLDRNDKFQQFIRANVGRRHRFFDGADGYIRNPWRLPNGHPNNDHFFEHGELPAFPRVYVPHDDIGDLYRRAKPLPWGHPSVHAMLSEVLPGNHTPIDDLFRNPRQLPEWHPDLSLLLSHESLPLGMPSVAVYFDHPPVLASYLLSRPLPDGHPSVTEMLQPYLPPGHPPHLDHMLRHPEEHPLPYGHPNLSHMLDQRPLPRGLPSIPVYFHHPNATQSFLQNRPLPSGHVNVTRLLQDYLPPGHPLDLDHILRHPSQHALPLGHPDLAHMMAITDLPHEPPFLTLYFDHPLIASNDTTNMPASHPNVSDILAPYLPPNHPTNLDQMLRNSQPLPLGHPSLSSFLRLRSVPPIPVFADHPNPYTSYTLQDALPQHHPPVTHYLSDYLPPNHPLDLDHMLRHPKQFPLPNHHPNFETFLGRASFAESNDPFYPSRALSFSVHARHPDLYQWHDNSYEPFPHHPPIHDLFQDHVPSYHPDIDQLIQNGFELPRWHPELTSMISHRNDVGSPGALLNYAIGVMFLVVVCVRYTKRWKNGHSLMMIDASLNHEEALGDTINLSFDFSKHNVSSNSSQQNASFDSSELRTSDTFAIPHVCSNESEIECIMSPLPLSSQLPTHSPSPPPTNEPIHPSILIYQQKRNTALRSQWNQIASHRHRNGSRKEALSRSLLFFFHISALFLSHAFFDYNYDVAFGSLAIGSTLLLFLSAMRNGIINVMIPIDRSLVYHRFLGKIVAITGVIHACFYFPHWKHAFEYRVYATGTIALLSCGFVAVTSANVIRRRYFDVFYWSHFGFVGFLVGSYLHAPSARPFVLCAVVAYGGDKVARWVWTQLPQRTVMFVNEDDRTVRVRYGKTWLAKRLNRYRVGQYVFVNFPGLSLTQWHPYSITSGPREDHIEIYIKALGNHTQKIVEYAKRCAIENTQPLIRSDGPYGSLSFNYRRYGSLLLIAGGIGITPLIGLLKDIYGPQQQAEEKAMQQDGEIRHRKAISHCIKNVTLIWTMPHSSESNLFLPLLRLFRQRSLDDALMPTLNSCIHITRENNGDERDHDDNNNHEIQKDKIPMYYSRPDFSMTMNDCIETMRHNNSSSILVYACGPGSMVNQSWDASMTKNSKEVRVDFYHESFEF